MSESKSKPGVLSKNPSDYNFLTDRIHRTNHVPQHSKSNNQPFFPRKQPRIESKFKLFPFPHNEYIDAQIPDTELTEAQIQSTRRREPYPQMGKSEISESKPPGILDKNYDRRGRVVFKNQRPVLPLPSVLEKPMCVNEYTELLKNKFRHESRLERPGISTAGSSYGRVPDSMAFQGSDLIGGQTDFDDFMVQISPVIIYLQKKRAK
jgi:hypothetical protein